MNTSISVSYLKGIFILIIFFCFYPCVYAQRVKSVQFKDPTFFHKKVELSSLVNVAGSFYTVMEGCHTLLSLKLDDDSLITVAASTDLNALGMPINADLEGMAFYKGHLLITDEENACIYGYNIKSNALKTLGPPAGNPSIFESDKDEQGMEGIAVDTLHNKCYVLKERAAGSSSRIREFNISFAADGNLELTYVREFKIQHLTLNDDDNKNQRYTDLWFDHGNNRLYCLRSYLAIKDTVKRKAKDYRDNIQYKIDAINVNDHSGNKNVNLQSAQLTVLDITKEVDDCRFFADTNLEGITICDGAFYLVSDNVYGAGICAENAKKPTLFLKVEMPH